MNKAQANGGFRPETGDQQVGKATWVTTEGMYEMVDPGGRIWPDIGGPSEYRRLVWLARRRLIGHEHHAEDVVSRALIKWSGLPDRQRAAGHLEQVIKTEAHSLLRSEQRSRSREQRVSGDRSQPPEGSDGCRRDIDLRLLRNAIAETCKTHGISLTARDVEFIELLLAGLNLTQTQHAMEASRYEVRKLRHKWQRILRQTITTDMVG